MQRQQEKDCFERVQKLAEDQNNTRLLSFLNKATANPESSLFPDFLFDGGFIEHFQVSAANENRKGSAHNIAVNDFERESDTAFEQEKNDFLQSPPRKNPVIGTYDLKVVTHEMTCPEYSYESFVKSFKRNFEKHIRHLQDYSGDKTNGTFLIEFVGARVTIMRNNCFSAFYRLAVDRELLTYINQYAESLNFIIFVSTDSYEILELNEIPKLLNNIPKGINFSIGRYINLESCLFIDI
jgi:hypothetical protein